MTTHNLEYLVFMISFLMMTIDGKIDTSEMEFQQKHYNELKLENDMDYPFFANELLKQINQNGHAVYGSLLSSIPAGDLSANEKQTFLVQSFQMALTDGKLTQKEKDFLFQIKKVLSISDAAFSEVTTSYLPSKLDPNQNLEEFVESVELPQFELMD